MAETTKCKWIERMNVKEQVKSIIEYNLDSFLAQSQRANDYQFLSISGGRGVGKTRTGEEVPHMLGANAGFPAQLPGKSVHILIRPAQSPLKKGYPKGYGSHNKPPREREDDGVFRAQRAISLAIASQYLLNRSDWEAHHAEGQTLCIPSIRKSHWRD